MTEVIPKASRPVKAERATATLSWVALFLGELRDGLTMINMQSAFLMTTKNYSEKQTGILFFVFGMSQFMFQTPAGYLMDYSDKKVFWLGLAGVVTTAMTIFTALFAEDHGGNLSLMVFVKFLQGAITSLIPPGLNSITQGIVGSVGMTSQVSKNEMMNHLGTAIIVLTGSLVAFALYPNIGLLFIVSPIACAGFIFHLNQLKSSDIDHNAARGLVLTSDTTRKFESFDNASIASGNSYRPPNLNTSGSSVKAKNNIVTRPSFKIGFDVMSATGDDSSNFQRADTPLQVLRDPTLLTFIFIVFLFHLSNGTILPLVMQTLAIGNGRTGILMSGMCIIVAQVFMVMSAKICGDYSGRYGRKTLFLIGFFSVPLRCLILTGLLRLQNEGGNSALLQPLVLSTQILDGIGAGTFGTMYILVTSDISGGTGRFSLTLGLTTAAMSIGGTVSGYLGEALAQDIGYRQAFVILGFMSLVPALLYLFCMPETLPASHEVDEMPKVSTMIRIAEENEEGNRATEMTKPVGTGYTELV